MRGCVHEMLGQNMSMHNVYCLHWKPFFVCVSIYMRMIVLSLRCPFLHAHSHSYWFSVICNWYMYIDDVFFFTLAIFPRSTAAACRWKWISMWWRWLWFLFTSIEFGANIWYWNVIKKQCAEQIRTHNEQFMCVCLCVVQFIRHSIWNVFLVVMCLPIVCRCNLYRNAWETFNFIECMGCSLSTVCFECVLIDIFMFQLTDIQGFVDIEFHGIFFFKYLRIVQIAWLWNILIEMLLKKFMELVCGCFQKAWIAIKYSIVCNYKVEIVSKIYTTSDLWREKKTVINGFNHRRKSRQRWDTNE